MLELFIYLNVKSGLSKSITPQMDMNTTITLLAPMRSKYTASHSSTRKQRQHTTKGDVCSKVTKSGNYSGNVYKTFRRDNYKSDDEMRTAIETWLNSIRIDNHLLATNRVNYSPPDINSRIHYKNVIDVLPDIELQFDNKGPQQASTLIVGSSKRGKSTLIAHIHRKYYHSLKFITTLFSANAFIPLYSDFYIKADGFEAPHQRYLELQHGVNTNTNNKYMFNNCFDDIVDIRYAKTLNKLILTYRNANMSTIISLQYARMLAKMARASVNHVILFGSNTYEAQKDVVDLFLKQRLNRLGITTDDAQIAFYVNVTKDHGFIYLNSLSDDISFHRLASKFVASDKA